jgi:hypothetical protein
VADTGRLGGGRHGAAGGQALAGGADGDQQHRLHAGQGGFHTGRVVQVNPGGPQPLRGELVQPVLVPSERQDRIRRDVTGQ